LTWKESDDIEHDLEGQVHRTKVRKNAESVSTFLYSALMNDKIRPEFRRYLVL
jgi:hypothetical protein